MSIIIGLALQAVVAAAPASAALDLTLEDAVARGLAQNFRVQRSTRNEAIADARVRAVRANLRPRFDLAVSASQNQSYYDFQGNAFQFNRAEPQFYADAYASASLPLDVSGVIRRQVHQTELSRDLGVLDRRQSVIDVSTDIRVAYVAALRAQELVAADQASLDAFDALATQVAARQPSVTGFLQTERANAVQALEGSKTGRDLALSALRQLLRLDRGTVVTLRSSLGDPAPVPPTDKLLQIASDNRIDLQQADIRLRQAQLAAKQASDARRPSVRLTAYGSQRFNAATPFFTDAQQGRTRSGGIVLTGTIPLLQYDGGALREQRRITSLQAEQAVADREEGIERAENEISQIMIGLDRATQRLRSLPDVAQARAGLERAERLLLDAPAADAAGLVAQVANARANWRTAVVSRNEALADYYTAYFRLQRAVGSESLASGQ